jgi:protein-S-isoprenylcysteine O-methyltransferase Ste14
MASLFDLPGMPAHARIYAWLAWARPPGQLDTRERRERHKRTPVAQSSLKGIGMQPTYGFGLWPLAGLNAAVFILFAWSFFKPVNRRDWRSLGLYSSFIIALFAEMYGFPLTIYLFSGWLTTRFPGVDWLSHDAGHLLEMLFGWRVNPHFGPFHLLSFVFIFAGFALLARAWPVLYAAQQEERMATDGPYAHVRHPQYVAFILIMFGFLLQWPTLLTVLMFPVLVFAYTRLAHSEEKDSLARFGEAYHQYMNDIPAFLPHVRRKSAPNQHYGAPTRVATKPCE